MTENIVKQYLSKLSDANSNDDIDKVLNEIVQNYEVPLKASLLLK